MSGVLKEPGPSNFQWYCQLKICRLRSRQLRIAMSLDNGKILHLPRINADHVKLFIGSHSSPKAFRVEDQRKGGEPYAIKGLLGWTVIGQISKLNSSKSRIVNFKSRDTMLDRLWTHDFPNITVENKAEMPQEDVQAFQKYE